MPGLPPRARVLEDELREEAVDVGTEQVGDDLGDALGLEELRGTPVAGGGGRPSRSGPRDSCPRSRAALRGAAARGPRSPPPRPAGRGRRHRRAWRRRRRDRRTRRAGRTRRVRSPRDRPPRRPILPRPASANSPLIAEPRAKRGNSTLMAKACARRPRGPDAGCAAGVTGCAAHGGPGLALGGAVAPARVFSARSLKRSARQAVPLRDGSWVDARACASGRRPCRSRTARRPRRPTARAARAHPRGTGP